MALSEAMRKRINNDVETKKSGGSSGSAAPSTQRSTSLSSATLDRIRKDVSMKRLGREDPGVDDEFVKKFEHDYQMFLYKSQYDWKNMTYQSGRDGANASKREATVKDLADRATAIRTYLDFNKDSIDSESYKSMTSYLDAFDTNRAGIMHDFTAAQNLYNSFETEEDYNKYSMGWLNPDAETNEETVANRKAYYDSNVARIEELEEKLKSYRNTNNNLTYSFGYSNGTFDATPEEKKKIQEELAARKAENLQYKRTQGKLDQYYKPVTEEFTQNAAYRDYSNPTREDLWEYDMSASEGSNALSNGGSFDEEGNIRDAKGNIVQYANAPVIEDKLGMFLAAGTEDITEAYNMLSAGNGNYTNTWANLMQEGDVNGWKYLEPTEVDIYYDLLKREGQEAAYKFLSDMTTELTRRETQATTDYINEAPFLEQIALNAASIPMSVIGGGISFVDDAINILQGEDINPYSRGHAFQNAATDIRANTAEDINNLTGNWALPYVGTTFGDAYQAIMSAGDMYFGSLLGGGGKAYEVLMGMGAASAQAKKLYEQGASTEQMIAGGLLAGAAESFFEKYSIEHFVNLKNPKSAWDVAFNWITQSGVEASEEMATEFANMVTDAIVMGSRSDLRNYMNQYIEEGDSEALATVKALFNDVAPNVLNAGIGGFISGGFGGGIKSTYNYSKYNNQLKKTGKAINYAEGGLDALKALANEVSGVSDTAMKGAIAKQTSKVDKKASNRSVGKLYEAVQTANKVANTSQNQADIAKSLERKGFNTETANDIASALVASYNGQTLTKAQSKLLESVQSSKAVSDVISNIIGNEKSTMGQRQQNIRDFQDEVHSGQIARTYGVSVDKVKDMKKGIFTPETEKVAEGRYEVSVEGKTVRKSDGEIINIKGISSIEKGKLILDTDAGAVDASDVAYATKDQALVYEAVANIGGIINAQDANKLVEGFSKANGMSAAVYARGITQAYTYGYYGYAMADAMGEKTMSSALTDSQRNTAFALGRVQRKADAAKAQEERSKYKKAAEESSTTGKKGGVYFRNDNMEVSDIDSYLESAGTVLKDVQKVSIETMKNLAEALDLEFYVYESYVKNGKRYYIDEDGVEQEGAPNGWYDTNTGKVYIDLHAGAGGKGTMLFTIAHELTHFIHQWSPEKFTKLADIIFTHGNLKGKVAGLVAEKMRKAENRGKPIKYEVAYEEVVADAMESILKSGRVMEMVADVKQQDRGLWQKICEWFKDLADYLKRVVDAYQGKDPDSYEGRAVASMKGLIKEIEAIYAEALVDASENYQSFMTMATTEEIMAVQDGTMFSYSSLAEAAGFTAVENADGSRSFTRDGSKVTKVTVEDIENSPIGALINFSLDKKDISKADADRQKKMFAEICTLACKTNDFAMTMQFVGSAVFTGMKANADKQYGTTYDFPSICTKTQAVIDAMSAKMVKLGRGLNSKEIVELYREVFASGNPVPCPECYVFSRWIGIGGLLDNIKKYQDYYGNMSVSEAAAAYRKMHSEIEAFAKEQGLSFGKAKGALTSKLTKEYNKITEKIEKAQNQGENVKAADLNRQAELEPMMNTVKAMTWLENVYFADSSLTKVNKRFRVPNEVLFDLNNGEAFVTQYPEAWAFRTTQGAGYGKAITPYAEARLGEGILVTNNTTNAIKGKAKGTLNNYFLQQKGKLDKTAAAALEKARLKQKIQAFIGGQRFQSTSDARFENASDYLLAALEMQAMGGMVQVYTKVDGAVPAFSAWGFSINQSLMPLGGGLDENGNVKDTSVGGMSPKVAFENRNNHETAGTITIGVNDNHIRAMFKQWVRDFIIPYHASGGKADVVSEFRTIQEGQEKRGKMVRSTDYSRTQSDKVLSDDVLSWQGKTAAQIQRIHEIRDARIAILTGGKVDMAVVRSNRFLSALYDKLHDGEWKGVKLAKSKVESHIPQ